MAVQTLRLSAIGSSFAVFAVGYLLPGKAYAQTRVVKTQGGVTFIASMANRPGRTTASRNGRPPQPAASRKGAAIRTASPTRKGIRPVPIVRVNLSPTVKKTVRSASGKFTVTPSKNSLWQDAAVEIVAAGRGRINYSAGIVKAIGLGAIAPPTMKKSRSQDILDAREAAFNDALRSLSLAVSQVRVTADTRVSSYVLKSDEVRTRVEGLIRHATVIEEKLLPKSGVYRLVVQASMAGPHSLMEAIDTVTHRPTPAPSPTPVPVAEKPNPFAPGAAAPGNAEYSSLVVDCRGLGVSACMSPRLYDSAHNEIYGTMKISPEYVIETGIVAYPRSLDEARRCQRVGSNPLVVRAVGVADNNRFYPILKNRDAERARSANETSRFFERTAVVFVVDP
ncbi:MAG: hypothetical protein SFU56_03830 [Capsulimonadales bacterium]|nr:hypothetical protein [Capsulimonadales bacterium]